MEQIKLKKFTEKRGDDDRLRQFEKKRPLALFHAPCWDLRPNLE